MSGVSSTSGSLTVNQVTPLKGPSRYLTTGTEAVQVQRKSRQIMASLPRHKESRTKSPGISQSPTKPRHFLNGIQEDFSPSPVPVTRRVTARPGPPLCPRERFSSSFQPTPARFREQQTVQQEEDQQGQEKEGEKEKEEVEKINEEETPVDKVEKEVPKLSKAPSEVSEVTFKLPVVPSKGSKKKDPPVSTETLESGSRYLHSWIPRLRNKKLYIEGEYIDFDASRDSSTEESRRYLTSKIVSRISSNRVATKKRVYVLEGPLVVKDLELEKKNPTPLFIFDKFGNGFPENWQKIVLHWAKFEERNKQNISNMSLISSTLLSSYSMMGTTLMGLSNVSAINAVNGSHFIVNLTTATSSNTFTASNLSISKQPNISVRPEPVMDMIEEEALEDGSQGGQEEGGARAAMPVDQILTDGQDDVDEEEVVKEKSPQESSQFTCEDCQFTGKNQHGLNIHLRSKKHLRAVASKKGEAPAQVRAPVPAPSKRNGKRKVTELQSEEENSKRRKNSESVSPRGKKSIESESNENKESGKKRGRPGKVAISPSNAELKKRRKRVEKNLKKRGPQSKDTNQTKSPETENSRSKKLGKGKEKSGAQKDSAQRGEESQLNMSTFGRVRRQNKKYIRESCVYNTPEEAVEISGKKQSEVSLRRVVLNPFRNQSGDAQKENVKKPPKDIGEILKKVSGNPKTVKQRLQNVEALKNYNEDHEDDFFDEPVPGKTVSGSLKASTKSTLLSQDESDSDMDISLHAARTPVTGKFFTPPNSGDLQRIFQPTLVKGVSETSTWIKLRLSSPSPILLSVSSILGKCDSLSNS